MAFSGTVLRGSLTRSWRTHTGDRSRWISKCSHTREAELTRLSAAVSSEVLCRDPLNGLDAIALTLVDSRKGCWDLRNSTTSQTGTMLVFRKPIEGVERPQMPADVVIVGGGPAGWLARCGCRS